MRRSGSTEPGAGDLATDKGPWKTETGKRWIGVEGEAQEWCLKKTVFRIRKRTNKLSHCRPDDLNGGGRAKVCGGRLGQSARDTSKRSGAVEWERDIGRSGPRQILKRAAMRFAMYSLLSSVVERAAWGNALFNEFAEI